MYGYGITRNNWASEEKIRYVFTRLCKTILVLPDLSVSTDGYFYGSEVWIVGMQ